MIFQQALADCNVGQAMARHAVVRGSHLHIDGEAIDLRSIEQIRIVAIGKAAKPMLQAIWEQLPPMPWCDVAGVAIAPEPPDQLPDGFAFFSGGHPLPTTASFSGAQAALDLVQNLPKDSAAHTLCLFFISGGASAMMELPLDPTISLADTVEFHRALVASGASITEINCVRKHFSAVKGGRLAVAAGEAICRTFLISDVPAGHEDALGSGPTLPDTSTVADCQEILARYRLLAQFPPAVQRFITSATLPETPKPSELQAKSCVVISSDDMAHAARARAQALGFTVVVDNTCDDWEYRVAAKYLLDRLRTLRKQHPRVCLISVGEVVVALPTKSADGPSIGIGGRNQQFALYVATLLARDDRPVAVLSAGSDGIDGNSIAAGAVIDEHTLTEAKLGPSSGPAASDVCAAFRSLDSFDAYPFLLARNATVLTGPSGNNLRDLRILMADGFSANRCE